MWLALGADTQVCPHASSAKSCCEIITRWHGLICLVHCFFPYSLECIPLKFNTHPSSDITLVKAISDLQSLNPVVASASSSDLIHQQHLAQLVISFSLKLIISWLPRSHTLVVVFHITGYSSSPLLFFILPLITKHWSTVPRSQASSLLSLPW